MITQEEIDRAIKASIPDIVSGLKDKMTKNLIQDAYEIAANAVKKEVDSFVADELCKSLRASLIESKDGLIKLGADLSAKYTEMIFASLVDDLKKKLENSYNRSKILDALFKS